MNIRNGVIKNPPPTPNNPDNTPTEQLKNSNKWLISINDPILAASKIKDSKIFKIIKSFNQNILIKSKSDDTVNQLNQLLTDVEIYKISKESNLIEYFKND